MLFFSLFAIFNKFFCQKAELKAIWKKVEKICLSSQQKFYYWETKNRN
ncbi:MAG: hypothetical protein MRECE_4c022 [Mycoplasmataceae bacterium CE_OT135]|nr:MAG: hypothetical protein MRECE_4c022 [Mycoplasmataceae bacterium CE_OT135]